MKNYFSTLAAILSAVAVVLIIRSCGEYLDQQARAEAEARANASPTPWMPPTTPTPTFVRVTVDLTVGDTEGKEVMIPSGSRLRVISKRGDDYFVEYKGGEYLIPFGLTQPTQ